MSHLVLLSGGPDSAVSLKMALTETDEQVTALFVSFHDEFGRWKKEQVAAQAIHHYCKATIRQHDLLVCNWVMPYPKVYADIPALASFAAAHIVSAGNVTKVWLGVDADYDDKPAGRHFREALKAHVFEERFGIKPPVEHFPMGDFCMSKQEVRDYIGETLWNLSWSCRTPKGPSPCGTCYACLRRLEANGPTETSKN